MPKPAKGLDDARPALETQNATGRAAAADTVPLKYARGFSVRRLGNSLEVLVRKPWQGAAADFRYRLLNANSAASDAQIVERDSGEEITEIHVPPKRIVTLTTTNLHDFESLGILDALVGIGGKRYVCNPAVLSRVQAGLTRDVGEDVRLDLEALLDLKPDLVFTYVVGNSSDGGMAKLAETHVTTVLEGSYMEESPLGRAEWIKFTGAFFGKGRLADSLFARVDSAYQSLAASARGVSRRPTVFVNAPFGGVWWMPSGRTYVARLLADAGADYLWADDTTRGSLSLGMEAVLGKASDAEFWLNPGDWRSLDDGKSRDPRNAYFKAFREGNVYANDVIRCGEGGNDFYETGAARPDLILADLIAIFHPELLPNHRMRWYRKVVSK